ncbi:hypothetical protein B382_14528 [Stutzerimonas stutzeri B1SMN1]|nr:hypothetical protein B382_14528 [Stutzerimonas stutzeri B1SMN1]
MPPLGVRLLGIELPIAHEVEPSFAAFADDEVLDIAEVRRVNWCARRTDNHLSAKSLNRRFARATSIQA